jgi:hypothetical protein
MLGLCQRGLVLPYSLPLLLTSLPPDLLTDPHWHPLHFTDKSKNPTRMKSATCTTASARSRTSSPHASERSRRVVHSDDYMSDFSSSSATRTTTKSSAPRNASRC